MRNEIVMRLVAGAICVTLAAPACASAGRTRATATPADSAVLVEFVQKLPLGTAVRVDQKGGATLRGTLMKTSSQSLIVQLRTRIPEPPVEVPFGDVLRVTPEFTNGNNLGKAVGIGIAAGAGAALSVFLIIAAIFAGS